VTIRNALLEGSKYSAQFRAQQTSGLLQNQYSNEGPTRLFHRWARVLHIHRPRYRNNRRTGGDTRLSAPRQDLVPEQNPACGASCDRGHRPFFCQPSRAVLSSPPFEAGNSDSAFRFSAALTLLRSCFFRFFSAWFGIGPATSTHQRRSGAQPAHFRRSGSVFNSGGGTLVVSADAAGKRTGLPVLYNTPFNLFGEPLVASPRCRAQLLCFRHRRDVRRTSFCGSETNTVTADGRIPAFPRFVLS
jgi:hypothetical protein